MSRGITIVYTNNVEIGLFVHYLRYKTQQNCGFCSNISILA